MPTWTNPRTAATNDLFTADWWNTDVRDNLNVLRTTGTFTPVIGGSGGTSGQTYSKQIGRYIKIGPAVIAFGVVTLSAKGTITGNVQIQGLPYTSENVANQSAPGIISLFQSLNTAWITLGLLMDPNTTAATIYGRASAGTSSAPLASTDLTNSTELSFSITYYTAS